MKNERLITIDDLRIEARRRLPKIAFDFIDGGVEVEHCLERNRAAFGEYRLLPRYCVDVSKRSQTAAIFGRDYDSPFGICPTGMAGLWRAGADDMLADVAAEANIPFIQSCASTSSAEEAVRRAGKNLWFQLYNTRSREIGERLTRHIQDLGVETLVITSDVPVTPKRERNIRNGFTRPLRFKLSTVIDGLSRPRWLLGYLRGGGGTPMMPNWRQFTETNATPDEVADFFATQTPASDQTWRDLEHCRRVWRGNLVVKGILHPEDAVRATSVGVDGIIVSNHGGRQLDMAPSPIEVLPLIRAAVGADQTVMLDSGVRRGSDILIALCLGAQFVFFGRPTLYGVAALGLPGARKAVDILRKEIDLNMAQLGRAGIAELGPHCLMRRQPPFAICGPDETAHHDKQDRKETVHA